mgnify:FL=1
MFHGNHEKVWTHVTIDNIRQKPNSDETKNVGKVVNKYIDKLEKELLKILETKKSMKVRLRVGLNVKKETINDKGEKETKNDKLTIISKKWHTVTKKNLREILELEADAVEAKAEYIADEMEGSVVNNEGVKSVSADVAQTKIGRAHV